MQFAQNWSALVTHVDVWTEPELVPGLPKNAEFRIGNLLPNLTSKHPTDRIIGFILIPILFLPTWIFRLTLKSTFLIYWPLLFVASAPSAVKVGGTLVWDDAKGRGVADWIYLAMAVAAMAAILSTIYDPNFFASFVAWADPRGLPSHVILQAVSFKVWELDLWEWSALSASVVTIIVFVWSNGINIRHRGRDRQPGWLTLKVIYALGRVKVLLVGMTILASVYAMVWFVHDTCTLPDLLTSALVYVFGPPAACVGA